MVFTRNKKINNKNKNSINWVIFFSELKEKRILLTGAAGFIGSNLTDALLKEGAKVIGIDNLFNGRLENLSEAMQNPNFMFHKADIRDSAFLLELCKDIDIIYHVAAFTSVHQSVEMPISCNDVNINGTLNVLNAARIRDVESIIFASSCAVYGDMQNMPIREDMEGVPMSPYAVSKLACEKYLYVFFKVYGLKTIILRYFNVYGSRQKDSPYSGVISIWLGHLYRNKNLIVYGDGEQNRDFVYIKDAIKANLLAGLAKNIAGEIFNIATGSSVTINTLATIMKQVFGKKNLKVEHIEPRLGDIRNSCADITKARKHLKFEPIYNIHSGLQDYIQ